MTPQSKQDPDDARDIKVADEVMADSEDGWFCDWCDKPMRATEKGYSHVDGVVYCSRECAEEKDANR